MSGKAIFIHGDQLEKAPYPADCPFKTQRAAMTRKALAAMGMLSGKDHCEQAPVPAERKVLETFHTPGYLDAMQAAEKGHASFEAFQMGLGTVDCPVFKGMYDYAVLACGATLTGAREILSGRARVAFNPSGGYHHAGPAMASGFCYINDSALGCMVLAEGGRRVLYLDVDVHHGDGVQGAFYARSDVMTVSFHESGRTQFPGTGFEDEIGTGAGRGYSVNVPLPVGTYDEAYLRAFDAVAVPLIGAYDPDVIVMELGLDGLAGDPLGHLSLTNNAYAAVVERVMRASKPVLAVGGGGYHPENTARGWALAWCIFIGEGDSDRDHPALGGVMLESTDWPGGLRDRVLVPSARQLEAVDPAVQTAVDAVKANVFGFHGL